VNPTDSVFTPTNEASTYASGGAQSVSTADAGWFAKQVQGVRLREPVERSAHRTIVHGGREGAVLRRAESK
jgi:hypothetical protein